MHRVFQSFVDRISNSVDTTDLKNALSDASKALELSCFAYLALPERKGDIPRLISTYPEPWTDHYLRNHYERLDPVVVSALSHAAPFEWGSEILPSLSRSQKQLFDEAAQFGIRRGFTVPIHDSRRPVAAITFASSDHHRLFHYTIKHNKDVLQLMAMYFHAHARRMLASDRVVDGVRLSPREFECLEWTAQGKSAWEIGRILGISRRTAAFHLDNAKAKLGVHSNYQAVARFAASRSRMK